MAFITGEGKHLGDSISIDEAEDYIFGMVIFNDWSMKRYSKMGICTIRTFFS